MRGSLLLFYGHHVRAICSRLQPCLMNRPHQVLAWLVFRWMGDPTYLSTSRAGCLLREIVMLVANVSGKVVIGMQFQQQVRNIHEQPRGF